MSVVFGLLRNDYEIIVTDTRIILSDNSKCLYVDDYEKIYMTQYGWVSGTGVGELIRKMANNFDGKVTEKRYREISKLSKKYPLEDLLKTLIIYSTFCGKKQLKMYYIGNNYRLTEVPKDFLIGMPPADIQEINWNNIYTKCFKKLNKSPTNINNDIEFITEAVYNVSKSCQSVSEICDVGILKSDGKKIRIREKYEKIINE